MKLSRRKFNPMYMLIYLAVWSSPIAYAPFREQKELSQGDIEQRTGRKRCSVSRFDNSHTVPSIATLEKLRPAPFGIAG